MNTQPSLVVRIFPSRQALGEAAAADVAQALRDVLARQDVVRMVFAAAPSQTETLGALVAQPGIDWQRVDAFHMDEYAGLPPEATQRFGNWLQRHLFERLPFRQVHLIRPEQGTEACIAGYTDLLRSAPLDIVCLGIGVNGHLAFNDPPVADFRDPVPVKLVALDEICRRQQVDDGAFPQLHAVPTHAVTLTIPCLLSGHRLFCAVPGAAKREAVQAALYGPISEACPASALRTHPNATLYLDTESAPNA